MNRRRDRVHVGENREQVCGKETEGKPIFERPRFMPEPESFEEAARKKAEEALRQSEEKYKNLFDMVSDAIFLSEASTGRIIDANQACSSLYGYPHDELLQMSIVQLSNEQEETHKALSSRQEYVPFRYHRKKDGTVFPVEIAARNQEWEGREVRIGVIRDITARMKIEEERERLEKQLRQALKMEAIGTLAGGIAHDFNNILGVILGCSELLLMKASEQSREREHLDQIYHAGERARDLVRQILAFSRQGEQLRVIVRVDLVVKEALKFLRASLPSTIEIRRGNSREVRVLADPTQVHQIIMNLCVNAAHAMREKGGVLTVEVGETHIRSQETIPNGVPVPGRFCRLSVSDTGCGISRSVIDHIFDPYFTTKKPGEGTGLGLSVAYGIVKSHCGGITVESNPGEGTTFHVLLPMASSSEVFGWDSERDLQRGKGERLLLVDDEAMLAGTMKRMLEELGYTVILRTSSMEALDVFQSDPDKIDLVITDMTMPHMTGLDLAKRIAEVRPGIPVILCTGYSENAAREKMKQAGIRKLVMKPIVLRDIAGAIRQIMDGKSS